MSYILDALKKSDQQRQRSAAPTLPPAQAAMALPKRSFTVHYGVLAVTLLCAGIAIGWLRPWQAEPAAARPTPAQPEQALQMPRADQTVMAARPEQTAPPAGTAPVAASVAPGDPADLVRAGPEQKALPMSELPLAIQSELPVMTMQLHSYSSKPANSMVSINSRILKEGESLSPGLKLERITAEGAVFSFKGYRFLFGIR